MLIRLLAIAAAVVIAACGGYLLGRQSDRAGGRASSVVHTDLTYLTALTRPMQSTPGDPIYMHFGSIQGGGTGRFAGWIPLEGWQWGLRADATSAGAPLFTPVTVSFPADQATSPILGLGAANKPVHGPVQVVFVMGPSRQVTYLQVTLQNTTISSFSETSSGGKPNDTLSLTVGQFEYQANTPKGTPVKFCWNLLKSDPCTF